MKNLLGALIAITCIVYLVDTVSRWRREGLEQKAWKREREAAFAPGASGLPGAP